MRGNLNDFLKQIKPSKLVVSSQGQAQLSLLPPDMLELGDDLLLDETPVAKKGGKRQSAKGKSGAEKKVTAQGIKQGPKVSPSLNTSEAGISSQQSTSSTAGRSSSTQASQPAVFSDSQGNNDGVSP